MAALIVIVIGISARSDAANESLIFGENIEPNREMGRAINLKYVLIYESSIQVENLGWRQHVDYCWIGIPIGRVYRIEFRHCSRCEIWLFGQRLRHFQGGSKRSWTCR